MGKGITMGLGLGCTVYMFVIFVYFFIPLYHLLLYRTYCCGFTMTKIKVDRKKKKNPDYNPRAEGEHLNDFRAKSIENGCHCQHKHV